MRVSTLLLLPRTVRSAHRLREMLAVLARHGFGEIADALGLQSWAATVGRIVRRGEEAEWTRFTVEERIRMAFEDLGPTWVKLGQNLATRPDLVPMSLVHELRKLQDDVPPFGMDEVRQVIEEDLGRPLEEVFETFDTTPMAAASIAQVHRARLRDEGERADVVVKVQRPELRRVIDRDLSILQTFARLMHDKVPEARRFDLPGIATEFAAALRLEADFTNERGNLERFNRLWADDEMVSAPRTYPAACSQRVLTMERIDGVKVTDVDGLRRVGADPRDVAQRGTHVALRSIFEHGFFHADPHPGNFFVLEGGRIALIDFGMMGTIDRERLDELLTFLVSILLNDPDMMVRLFVELDIVEDTTDVRSLKREVKAIIDRYYNVPIGEIDIARFIQQVFEVVVRHDVRLPADLLLVGKAVATMEGIAQEIDPSFDPIAAMRPYLMRTYVIRVLDPAHHARGLARDASDLALLLRKLPGDIRMLMRRIRRGQLRIVTAHEDLDTVLEQRDHATNRKVITAVGCTALVCGTAFVLGGDVPSSMPFWILSGLFGAWAWLGIMRTGGP